MESDAPASPIAWTVTHDSPDTFLSSDGVANRLGYVTAFADGVQVGLLKYARQVEWLNVEIEDVTFEREYRRRGGGGAVFDALDRAYSASWRFLVRDSPLNSYAGLELVRKRRRVGRWIHCNQCPTLMTPATVVTDGSCGCDFKLGQTREEAIAESATD